MKRSSVTSVVLQCLISYEMSGWPAEPISRGAHLEVEDASISVVKVLVRGHDSGQSIFLEGQGSNGRQEPTITCDAI